MQLPESYLEMIYDVIYAEFAFLVLPSLSCMATGKSIIVENFLRVELLHKYVACCLSNVLSAPSFCFNHWLIALVVDTDEKP